MVGNGAMAGRVGNTSNLQRCQLTHATIGAIFYREFGVYVIGAELAVQ